MTVESSVTPQISPGCSRCSRWLWLWRRPMHGNHNMSLVSVPAFSGRAASVFSVCDPTGHSRAWKCSSCQFTCSVQWQKTGPLERLLVHGSNDNPKLKRQISDDAATNYCKKNKKTCTITACGPRNESHRCVINIFFFLFLKCGFTLRLFCLLNNRFWTNGICFFFYIFFWVISYFNSPICCAICAPHSLFCFLLDQHTSWQPYSLKPK